MRDKKGIRFIPVVVVILCLASLTSCGLWKRYTASSQIKKVEKKIEEATQKEAPKYTSELFDEGKALVTEAKSLLEGKKYDEAIQKANDSEAKLKMSIEQVDTAKVRIQKAQKDLQDRVNEVKEIIEKAEQSGGAESAPVLLEAAKNEFTTLTTASEEQKQKPAQKMQDYEAMMNQADLARQSAQKAYNQTLKKSAEEASTRLATLMAEATGIPAREYAADAFIAAESEYSSFQAQMQNEEFEKAYLGSTKLEENLQTVLLEAKRYRADAFIQKASGELEAVRELGGLIYALEQMQAANEALRQAGLVFDASDFDQSYGYSQRALESLGSARTEVASRATEILQEADKLIETAEQEGAPEFAPDLLDQAKQKRGEARLSESASNLHDMLSLGAEALDKANQALLLTKKKKASAAIDQAQQIVDQAVREGAEKYAKEPLWKVQQLLVDARKRFAAEEYIEVHPLANEAKMAAEDVLEALKSSAQTMAEQARLAYRSTTVIRAEEFAPDLMRQATEQIATTESKIQSAQYLSAHQAAEQALALIKKAEQQTYSARVDKNRTDANSLIDECKKAGADTQAAEAFHSAVSALLASEKALTGDDYPTALAESEKAVVQANKAKMNRIAAAEHSMARATTSLASEYAQDNLKQGQTLLAQAKLSMRDKDYSTSNTLADQAAGVFSEAETLSWKARSDQDIAFLDAQLAKANEQGAPEKAVELYALAVGSQGQAKALSTESKFKQAEETAVLGLKQTQDTLTQLGQRSAAIADVLRKRAEEIQTLVVDSSGREKLAQYVQFLSAVQSANQDSQYAQVFQKEEEGAQFAQDVELGIEDHNLVELANGSGKLLLEYQTNGIAGLVPKEWDALRQELISEQALIGNRDYADSQKLLTDLLRKTTVLKDEGMNSVRIRLDGVRQRLSEIKTGGVGVLADDFDLALKDFQTAQQALASSDYFMIAEKLVIAEKETQTMEDKTKDAFLEKDYKKQVIDQIKRIRSLLDGFDGVLSLPIELMVGIQSSASTDAYQALQGERKASSFSKAASLLLTEVKENKTPPTMLSCQALNLHLCTELEIMANLFEKYGRYDEFEKSLREQALKDAYAHHKTVIALAADLEELVTDNPNITEAKKKSPFSALFPSKIPARKKTEEDLSPVEHANLIFDRGPKK